MKGHLAFAAIFTVFSVAHSQLFPKSEMAVEPVQYFVSYSHRTGFGNIKVEFENGGIVAGIDEVRKIEQYIRTRCPQGIDTASILVLNIQPFPIK